MERGGNRSNPWHQKRGGGSGGGGFNASHSNRKKHGSAINKGVDETADTKKLNSTAKFEAAKLKMEEAVKRNMVEDYDSSDDEDDVLVDPILGK